ncbi:MAG TPA: transporter substrate-binding domain-containing protein [Candidatus Omnitrophota bacterium]|nr:transporter substrate-binding domain-containing protein [Candidatus Omnitrophota bacterium]
MLVRLFAVVLLALLSAMPVGAAERDIVVGVEELDYYPLYSVWDGEYVGTAREILDSFAKSKGYRITYRPLPIKRLYAELVSGGIDLKFPDNPYWAADVKAGAKVVYSQPVIAYVDGVMVPPASVGNGADGIKVLGTVAGFTPFAWLDRIKANQTALRENPKLELLLKQAAVKRVDGAYASVAVANHYLEHVMAMPGALVFDPSLPHSRDFYMASSVKQPQLVAEFDAWLAANQPRVADIKRRFGAEKGVTD